MPSHRTAFLREAVESVLGQTFRDLELIVLAERRDEAAAGPLAGIDDPRLRLVGQPEGGLCGTLNDGLRRARGEFVARNDDDDVWLPHLLETLVPRLEADPALGLVYARSTQIDARGRPGRGRRGTPLPVPDDPFRSLLLCDATSSITSVCPRRTVLEVGGWRGGMHQDWDLALQIARRAGVLFVDEEVAHYRCHSDNVTALDPVSLREYTSSRRRVLERALSDDGGGAAAALRGRAWRNLYIGEANQWLAVGDRHEAVQAWRRALEVDAPRMATVGRIAWSLTDWFLLPRIPGARDLAEWALRASRSPQARAR